MYYLIAENMFLDNNYLDAQVNYQLSSESSKNSEFGKLSTKKNVQLINYSNSIEEMKYIKSLDNENNDPTFNNIDSLLYNVAEIFYFDFNHLDSSLYKFKTIIDNYPESDYRYKSLIIMNIEQPDTIWEDIIANDYDEKIHGIGEIDEIAQLRDKAWNLLGKSKDDAINEFLEINKEHVEGSDKYTIELLESNLQNKDKINKLWNTIKYRFIDRLLVLCRVLPLIIDLPDEIDTIVYSQWLLDNGFHFEYKFGDTQLTKPQSV